MLRWLLGKRSSETSAREQAASDIHIESSQNANTGAPAAVQGAEKFEGAGRAEDLSGDSYIAELKRQAVVALSGGMPEKAIDLFSRVVANDPMDAEAHCSLGKIYLERQQFDRASQCLQTALRCNPNFAEAHYRLGKTWQGAGKIDEAMASYSNAVKFNPAFAEAHNNLGVLHHERGNIGEAISCYQKAVESKPSLAPARYNLSFLLLTQGNAVDALQHFEKAIAIDPRFGGPQSADFYYNLGLLLAGQGKQGEALIHFNRAISMRHDFVVAHRAKGQANRALGQVGTAIENFQTALSINPDLAEVHNDLGLALLDAGKLSDATRCFQRAHDLAPTFPPFINNIGMALAARGNHSGAIQSFRRAIAIDPDFPDAHTNLLFYLSHDTTQSPQTVFDAHRAYADRVEAPLRPAWPTHRNLRDPRRTLRLGFVSADLRAHAVASFIEPLWLALDKSQFEIWVYSNHAAEDEVTKRLRNTSRNWRNVVNFSDADLVAAIQQDGIDILFDLSGHTFGNRLRAFAHKPAPIQVTWIGNPNTTGLQAMDYYLADRFSAPPGLLDSLFTEKIVRLPSGVLFQPFEQSPDVNSLPALSSNRMTFGSFSRGDKLVGEVAALWACVLAAVPGSQMLVGGVTADQQAHVAEQFSAHNVEASRLIFVPRSNMADYLAAHHRVDLILDTFPFNGGTTSCHAAWMGVPVLTIAGKTMASRVGVIINSNLGLFDFIAESNDDFVAKAQSWASRHQELAKLRSELRGRMAASPFCQPQRVTRWVETALRTMWQRWCAGEPPASFEVPE